MSENVAASTNDEFASKPVLSLFIKYSGLALIGLLAQGIMVFCEGVIVGNGLGTVGLAIVGILMPIEYFNLALHGFFGIGISTLCAMKVGDGEPEEAREYFSYGVISAAVITVVLTVIAFIFATPLARFLGATEDIMYIAPTAIRIFICFIPFATLGQVFNYMVRVDNQPKWGSIVVTAAAILSIAWLYTSTYILKLGIPGACIYYGMSIGLWVVLVIYFIVNKSTLYKVKASDFSSIKFDKVLHIMKIGFPYLFVQIASTVFGIVINNMLADSTAIAAWAITSGYTLYLLMMIMQACTQGAQPIASYNFGAKNFDRVKKTMAVAIIGTIVSVYVLQLFNTVFNKQICIILGAGTDAALLTVAMKCNFWVCIGSGLGMVADLLSGYFQAVERVIVSTILALARYIIFGIPGMIICKSLMGVENLWIGLFVGCVGAFVLSIIFAINESRRLDRLK